MISKVSNNKSFAVHNYLCGLKTKKVFAVIIGILHLFAAPAVAIAAIIAVYTKNGGGEIAETMAMIGAATTALAGLMGIYLAIDSFACLHNKNLVDMRFALPLNAKQRFFSNFFSGLTAYLAPFLAVQVISVLAAGYGCIFMDGRTFQRYINTDPHTGEKIYVDYVCEYFGEFMPVLLKLILCGTLAMLMLYTLTVLVTVCCGNLFESIGTSLLVNATIPLTILFVFEAMFSGLYGLGSNPEKITVTAIMYTSPAGGILAAGQWALGGVLYDATFGMEFKMNWALWVVGYLLLTAAMFAGALFLYGKRRARHTGKPFAFKFIYYLVSTAAMLFMVAMFEEDGQKLYTTVIATFLVYLMMECIVRRGFKRIWAGIIRYTCVIAASLLLIKAANVTEGFGMVARVPDISSVKSVEISSYGGFYGTLYLPYEIDRGEDNDYDYYQRVLSERTLTFTEKENIETILAAHKKLIENRDKGDASGQRVDIKYHLTGGRTMTRTYSGLAAEELEILGKLDLSEEYRTQTAEAFRDCLKNYPLDFEAYTSHIVGYDYYDASNTNYIYLVNESKTQRNLNGDEPYSPDKGVNIKWLIQKNFFEQLAEAYAADIMNISEENYYKNTSVTDSYFIYLHAAPMLGALNIPGSFENTIELMEYFGFTFDKKADFPDDKLKADLEDIAAKQAGVRIFTAAEWRELYKTPEGMPLHTYGGQMARSKNYIKDIDEDVIALYKAALTMNILPENGYIIYVSGEAGVVPEELYGAAERLYGKAYGPAGESAFPFWLVSNDETVTVDINKIVEPSAEIVTEVSD